MPLLADLVPFAAVLDKLVLDFDLLDIVVWFPRLSWPEVLRAGAAVVLCKCIGDRIERWLLAPLVTRVKSTLARRIARRWPAVARRLQPAAPA